MRITVSIPAELLKQAMEHSGAASPAAAVLAAVEDYNRRQRVSRLVAQFGTFDGVQTPAELRRSRRSGHFS